MFLVLHGDDEADLLVECSRVVGELDGKHLKVGVVANEPTMSVSPYLCSDEARVLGAFMDFHELQHVAKRKSNGGAHVVVAMEYFRVKHGYDEHDKPHRYRNHVLMRDNTRISPTVCVWVASAHERNRERFLEFACTHQLETYVSETDGKLYRVVFGNVPIVKRCDHCKQVVRVVGPRAFDVSNARFSAKYNEMFDEEERHINVIKMMTQHVAFRPIWEKLGEVAQEASV